MKKIDEPFRIYKIRRGDRVITAIPKYDIATLSCHEGSFSITKNGLIPITIESLREEAGRLDKQSGRGAP